jgi:hypothetical protein
MCQTEDSVTCYHSKSDDGYGRTNYVDYRSPKEQCIPCLLPMSKNQGIQEHIKKQLYMHSSLLIISFQKVRGHRLMEIRRT